MKRIALIAAVPLFAFMVAYSLDVGCFICLYGEERGGVAEKWINATFVAAVIAVTVANLWRQQRS